MIFVAVSNHYKLRIATSNYSYYFARHSRATYYKNMFTDTILNSSGLDCQLHDALEQSTLSESLDAYIIANVDHDLWLENPHTRYLSGRYIFSCIFEDGVSSRILEGVYNFCDFLRFSVRACILVLQRPQARPRNHDNRFIYFPASLVSVLRSWRENG